jgi:hypothetical protein
MGCDCCEGKCGKDVRVSFCPMCKSRSVGYVFGFGNIFGIIPKMKCRDCGFESATFPILVASQEDIKRAVEGMKAKRQTSRVASKKGGSTKKKIVKKVIKKKVVKRK